MVEKKRGSCRHGAFKAKYRIEKDVYFIQSECGLYALTGHRSANAQQCLFNSHMTPVAALPNLRSASWKGFLLLTPLHGDWDTGCVCLWCSDWAVVVLAIGVFRERSKQVRLWHLEWAGVKQLWLTNCVPLLLSRTPCWEEHLLESAYWIKHINGGWGIMQHSTLSGRS